MKIAQVAPLIESVPPRLYGGTERIASYLTEELVRLGHEVTLFASADSITSAELAPCCTARACASILPCATAFRTSCLMIDKVRERAKEFRSFFIFTSISSTSCTFPRASSSDLDDASWPAGFGRPKTLLFPLRRNAIGFRLERSAQTIAARKFCCDDPPWHYARPASAVV